MQTILEPQSLASAGLRELMRTVFSSLETSNLASGTRCEPSFALVSRPAAVAGCAGSRMAWCLGELGTSTELRMRKKPGDGMPIERRLLIRVIRSSLAKAPQF